jgi:ribosomal 30S subunit maturation factor RimM
MAYQRFFGPDHPWRNNAVSFNNKVESREAPEPLSGAQVLVIKKKEARLRQHMPQLEEEEYFLSSLTGLLCLSGIIWT